MAKFMYGSVVKKCCACKSMVECGIRKTGRPMSRCPKCHNEYSIKHYHKNKEFTRIFYRERRAKSRAKLKDFLAREKDRPCMDCGKRYPSYVMQFDHRNPIEKKFSIPQSAYRVNSEKLAAEIAKCDVVCANCHMERTHGPLQRNGARPKN